MSNIHCERCKEEIVWSTNESRLLGVLNARICGACSRAFELDEEVLRLNQKQDLLGALFNAAIFSAGRVPLSDCRREIEEAAKAVAVGRAERLSYVRQWLANRREGEA